MGIRLAGILAFVSGVVMLHMAWSLWCGEAMELLPLGAAAGDRLRRLTPIVQQKALSCLAVGGMAMAVLGSIICSRPHSLATLLVKLWRIASRERRLMWKELTSSAYVNDTGLVASLCMLGAILRWSFINRPIHFDEAYTFVRLAERPWHIAIANYTYPNNHILHTLFVKVSTSIFGEAEWAIRLPAFCAGVLLIASTFMLTRIAVDRSAAMLAAGLIAVSPRAIEFSVDGRGYTLQALLVTLAAAAILPTISDGTIRKFGIFAICSWLALWTLPTTLFFLTGISLWFVTEARRKRRFSRQVLLQRFGISVAVVMVLTVIVYMPAILYSGLDSLVNNKFVSGRPASLFLDGNAAELRAAWLEWPVLWFPGAEWVCLVLAVFYLVRGWPKSAAARMVAWLVAGTALMIVVRRMVPFARVYLFLLPFFFCCVSGSVEWAARFAGARLLRRALPLVYTWAVLVICVLLGVKVWSNREIEVSGETGVLLSAEAIARDLGEAGVSMQCIAGTIVPSLTVRYYFRRYVTVREGCNGRDSYVIVHRAVGETEEEVFQRLRLDGRKRRLWKSYPDASVLVLEGS